MSVSDFSICIYETYVGLDQRKVPVNHSLRTLSIDVAKERWAELGPCTLKDNILTHPLPLPLFFLPSLSFLSLCVMDTYFTVPKEFIYSIATH